MTDAKKLKEPVLLVLQRGKGTVHGTHGILTHNGEVLCYTLEEVWRDNQPRVSCIPPGMYQCVPHDGNHFKGVWVLLNVPGRSAILIHAGNTTADTEGCILVGLGVNAQGVTQSQAALAKLRAILPDRFTIEVRDA